MSAMNGTSEFQSFEFSWKRPKVQPRLWSVFEGGRRLGNEVTENFIIQEMPEEMIDEVLDHVMNCYFVEETVSVYAGLSENPQGMRELRSFLNCWLLQGVSTVTFLVQSDPDSKPQLVGVDVLCVSTAQDPVTIANCVEKFRSRSLKKLLTVEFDLAREVDAMEMFGVDKCLDCFALSVLPSFQDYGLKERMLRTRNLIGRAYGVPMTTIRFTGGISPVIVYREGFQLLIEKNYNDLFDRNGNIACPEISGDCRIYYMAKRLN